MTDEIHIPVEQDIPAGSTIVITILPPDIPSTNQLVFTPTDVTQAWSGRSGPVLFPDVGLGPESPDRIIVVALSIAAGDDLDAVRVGAATLQHAAGAPTQGYLDAPQIWWGRVPTGTRADIELDSGSYVTECAIAVGAITGSPDVKLVAASTTPMLPSDDPHYLLAYIYPHEIAVVAVTVDRSLPTAPTWVNATGDAWLNEASGNNRCLLMAHGNQSNPGWSGGPGYGAAMALAVFSLQPVAERPDPPPVEKPVDPIDPEKPPIEPPVTVVGGISGPDLPIEVVEVTVVDTDEICLEVRDAAITHGKIISNNGVSYALTAREAFPIVGVSKSPVDGSVRITCTGSPFGPWYYDTDAGNAGLVGVAGVRGIDIDGSWDIRRVDADTADLLTTHVADLSAWVQGSGKVWDYSQWTTVGGKRGWLCGPEQDHFRLCDLESSCFLDRTAANELSEWTCSTKDVIDSVNIKSKNYDHGYVDSRTMGRYGETAALKHFIYLHFDAPLTPDVSYHLTNPAAGIEVEFTYSDRVTRAQGIRVSGVGHASDDASKLGYLCLWRPDEHDSAVDYGHFSEFEVIDESGATVGGPYPITLRIAADEAEERLGVGVDNILGGYPGAEGLIAYNSTAWDQQFELLEVSVDNPAEFRTVRPHGFIVGTKLRLGDMGGDGVGPHQLTHLTIKVANVSAPDRFTAVQYTGTEWTGAVSTLGMDPYTRWRAIGRTGFVNRLYQSNRAGTHVYALDYSKFVPTKPGMYRLRIAGLAVSDPVFITPTAWRDVAHAMAMGEYHHRWGIDLDGRFGVTRPKNYIDGETRHGNRGFIYQGKVPYPFGWGAPLYGIWPSLNDAACARPEAFMPDGKGGWHQSGYGHGGGSWADAGDWCTRVEQVCGAVYCFCELSLLKPMAAADTGFDIPKSSELFGAVYAGTDGMPDMVHQAIFGLEGYRLMQHEAGSYLPEGAVPGGLMMDTGTGTLACPSYLSASVNYANAPDHMSNYAYAFGAGKIAQLCYAYDHTDLGAIWEVSAEKAWAWAETLYHSADEREAYYNGTLGIEALAAQGQFVSGAPWTREQFVANCEALNRACEPWRCNAGAVLFRLTGAEPYRKAAEDGLGYTGGNPNNIWFDPHAGKCLGAWEYSESNGVLQQAKQVIEQQFTNAILRIEAGIEHFQGPVKQPCRTMMVADGGLWNMGGQGIDVSAVHWALIANHLISKDERVLKVLQDGMGFIYGANPASLSYVAQVGHRWPGTIFHADSLYAGRECDIGIGCYGPHFLGQWAFAFGTWKSSANAGCIESPDPRYAIDHIFEREIVPGRYATPILEAIWESHYQLNQMERSVQQNVFPLQNIAFYLHARGEE